MRTELRSLKALLIVTGLLLVAVAALPPTAPARAGQDKTDGRGDPAPRLMPKPTPRLRPRPPRPKPHAARLASDEHPLPSTDISHLDRFAAELKREPVTSEGYIICYAGRDGSPDKARRRCELSKTYLVKTYAFNAARLQIRDGGYREELTIELWIVPEGAQPPALSPPPTPEEVRRY
jgi:hypothetical protein